ncbi:hypothetical protein [Rhizobium lusitanum]|uniref:Uncharacterized protein n=1 Tax=Rhizobium lusitanum TaxID=293958 RepID=A0A7X0IVJ0_9HYPH|nr:hypothetical protein [Rhizobium lusitanum]MBB6487924.1 hypothetical protein [Rhizobium lusitanum]
MREVIAIKFGSKTLFYAFLADGKLREATGLEELRSLIRELVADESLEIMAKFFEAVSDYFLTAQRISVSFEEGKLKTIEIGSVSFREASKLFDGYHDARDFMIGAKANYHP